MPGSTYGGMIAVLAPRGRDAKVACDLLHQEGLAAQGVADLGELEVLVRQHIGAVLIAEEAISGAQQASFREAIRDQPAWSDIPFIVLTNGMAGKRSAEEERRIDALGNVVLLARPMHRDDIVRAVRSALKARQRQFEARARMEELREREEQLAESERKFHAIANSVDQMIWSTRPDGYHDYYNDRWYEYTGVPEGSTDGEDWIDVVHREDRERVARLWGQSLETGEPYQIEYRLRHRTGEYRWVLGKAQPLRDKTGGIVRWYGSCTDIHEQVGVRQELAASREVLEQAVAARTQELADLYQKTPVALHSLDREERIVSVSDRWLSFMGYDHPRDVIGRPATDFLDETCLADHNGPYRRRLGEEGVVYDLPYSILKKGGDRAEVLISARLTRDSRGNLERVMASVVDVTERKRAEAARDTAEEALRQSQKLETIGQLTGGVAHDFNNLLMAIKSSLELLRRRLPSDDDRSFSFLDNALAGVARGSTLTKRMLAFARKQELDTKAVDIAQLLPGMRDLLERSIGPQIDISLRISARVADALVDANQLELAILNLALNARDAMEGNGKLTIGLECVDLDEESGVEAGAYVRISVADCGPGMDAETLAKATEPFFTTKGVGRGTGLGLSMVHGLASQSNGLFRLKSELGEGTVAEIYLPVAQGPSEGGDEVPAVEGDAIERSKLTVLAVDDDGLVLFGTAALLEDMGHEVIEATSGAAALEVLAQRSDIDLVITDQAMPNMTGVELAHAAHLRFPDLPIILATGYSEMPEDAKDHIAARLEKPFSDLMLGNAIRAAMAAVEH